MAGSVFEESMLKILEQDWYFNNSPDDWFVIYRLCRVVDLHITTIVCEYQSCRDGSPVWLFFCTVVKRYFCCGKTQNKKMSPYSDFNLIGPMVLAKSVMLVNT